MPGKRKKLLDKVDSRDVATIEGEVIPLPRISKQDLKFCAHYACYVNGADAVRFAEYEIEPIGIRDKAYHLLTRVDIQAHIAHARTRLGTLHYDLGNQIIQQLNDMRLADPTEAYDEAGNIRDPRDWPPELKKLLVGIEVEEEMRGEGDETYLVRTKKVKFDTRRGVMETLAKIIGALKDTGGLGDGAGMSVTFNVTVGPQQTGK